MSTRNPRKDSNSYLVSLVSLLPRMSFLGKSEDLNARMNRELWKRRELRAGAQHCVDIVNFYNFSEAAEQRSANDNVIKCRQTTHRLRKSINSWRKVSTYECEWIRSDWVKKSTRVWVSKSQIVTDKVNWVIWTWHLIMAAAQICILILNSQFSL